jgi:hypothetical protein
MNMRVYILYVRVELLVFFIDFFLLFFFFYLIISAGQQVSIATTKFTDFFSISGP